MGEVVPARDGGAGPPNRTILHARVAGLRGWGLNPPKWPVRVELRDPGLLAIVRPRTLSDKNVAVLPLTQLELRVNAVQRRSGGGYRGGGYGIRGAATGIAMAAAMNRMTRQRWEETHLHIIQMFATGATRSITLSTPTHTPASLLEFIMPAIDEWASMWVRATIAGEIQPFENVDDLGVVYNQIDLIRERRLISPAEAEALASHHTRPLLAVLHSRLNSGDIDPDEAEEISHDIESFFKKRRITRAQRDTLRQAIRSLPSPETHARDKDDRETLIAELTALRRTGAITEDELQTEIARLRHP